MPPVKQGTPVQFRSATLEPLLQQRAAPGQSPGSIAARDLERYYALLAVSLPALSELETMALRDALNGTVLDVSTARLLWAGVDDAIRLDGLAEKWGIDGVALVARLRGLTLAQSLALVDAVERYWAEVSRA